MTSTRADVNRLGNAGLPLILEVAFRNLGDLEIQTSQILNFFIIFYSLSVNRRGNIFFGCLGTVSDAQLFLCSLHSSSTNTMQCSGWLSIYIPTQIWPI